MYHSGTRAAEPEGLEHQLPVPQPGIGIWAHQLTLNVGAIKNIPKIASFQTVALFQFVHWHEQKAWNW